MNTKEDAQHHTIGEKQVKILKRNYYTLIKWLKKFTKYRTTKRNGVTGSQTFFSGMQNGMAILENILSISYKVKSALNPWSINPTTIYLSMWEKKKKACTPSNLHANTYNSFVFHQQKLKTGQLCFNCGTNKQNVFHPNNGLRLRNTNERTNICNSMSKSQIERSQNKKDFILCDSIYLTFLHTENCRVRTNQWQYQGRHCLYWNKEGLLKCWSGSILSYWWRSHDWI